MSSEAAVPVVFAVVYDVRRGPEGSVEIAGVGAHAEPLLVRFHADEVPIIAKGLNNWLKEPKPQR